MILITSGAYLQDEFVSEVGLLPPSFLPVGNKCLYEKQVIFLRENCSSSEDIYLSIPESYKVGDYDVLRLQELGVRLIEVPDSLSLGESILYCWNSIGLHCDSLTLLHGDTLFVGDCLCKGDLIAVHENHGLYRRAKFDKNYKKLQELHDDWAYERDRVVSGFFRFSKPHYLMKTLIESKSDFIKAVIDYHKFQELAISSDGEWLDFGHINDFYRSRACATTQRVFNELAISTRTVCKSSKTNPRKIFAEGKWFEQLPSSLRIYTPTLLHFDQSGYQLEYLYLLPLSDLFVFTVLDSGNWSVVFNSIDTMLKDFASYPLPATESDMVKANSILYLEKTLHRLEQFSQETGFDVHSTYIGLTGDKMFTLAEMARYSGKWIKETTPDDMAIIHGDLCFSNLLYDARSESIKCIDPRGISANDKVSLYGDKRYELAKIYHSVVGLYDLIIAERFEVSKSNLNEYEIMFFHNKVRQSEIADNFRSGILFESGYEEKEILAITVHLFLSMLPLHSDNSKRQDAFIANALRLFRLLREDKV